jgi:hypothetical protein
VKYRFGGSADTVQYNAFLFMYEDGGGLVRLRYKDPVSKKDILEELDLQEENFFTSIGEIDSTKTKYKAINKRVLSDDMPTQKQESPIVFYFKTDAKNRLSPAKVSIDGVPDNLNNKPFIQARLIEKSGLNSAFLLGYFYATDELYNNFFVEKSRGLTAEEKKIRMHVIIVANSNDTSIGVSCAKDAETMKQMFGDIAKFLTLTPTPPIIIKGADYTLANVNRVIDNLKPDKNDVVVFYYSGHGYSNRVPNDPKIYPYLDLRANPKQDPRKETLNIEEVFNRLNKKPTRARLNLVIADCCNVDIIVNKPKGTKGMGKDKGPMELMSEPNLKTLFIKERGSILLTAAKKGQEAITNDELGSFYTYFFRSSMGYQCSIINNATSWDKVINDTKKLVEYKAAHTYCKKPYIPENICAQNPKTVTIKGN